MIVVKSMHEFLLMQKAGRIVATVLNELEAAIKPGVTTKELDEIAETTILKLGGVPAFKGYGGFPASICTSVNEEVVHGIPGKRVLKGRHHQYRCRSFTKDTAVMLLELFRWGGFRR